MSQFLVTIERGVPTFHDVSETPAPKPVSEPSGIEAQVCKDITDRQAVGVRKYGRTLEAANLTPAQFRQHKYEELLDAAIYAKAEIIKLDGREVVEGSAP